MDISFEVIVVAFFVFCYFVFGLKGAARFVDKRLGELVQGADKSWLRYVLIAILALAFAYIEFARILIMGILKIVSFIA